MEDYERHDCIEEDPYLLPGSTCLNNNLGFTNTPSLSEAEAEISALVLADWSVNPQCETFDAAHLKAIHRALFSEIYPFAGQFRTITICKGESIFLDAAQIEGELNECFESLRDNDFLKGLAMPDFADQAGFYLGWINRIHPFREGNGRTQRALISQLAAQYGYAFSWGSMSGEAMAQACREANGPEGSDRHLRRLLCLNIELIDRPD